MALMLAGCSPKSAAGQSKSASKSEPAPKSEPAVATLLAAQVIQRMAQTYAEGKTSTDTGTHTSVMTSKRGEETEVLQFFTAMVRHSAQRVLATDRRPSTSKNRSACHRSREPFFKTLLFNAADFRAGSCQAAWYPVRGQSWATKAGWVLARVANRPAGWSRVVWFPVKSSPVKSCRAGWSPVTSCRAMWSRAMWFQCRASSSFV